jgi:hypothetical protein
MVELERRALLTATVCANKCTLVPITCPHGTPDRGRHMPRVRGGRCHSTRTPDHAAPLALELLQQQADGPLEEDGRIAVRDRVAGQFLHSPQRVVRFARDGELNPEAFQCEWSDHGRL